MSRLATYTMTQKREPGNRLITLTNPVNDAYRKLGVQGDGETTGAHKGTGVWPAATNICTNGGFETNTTGWINDGTAVTLTRTTSEKKFGTASGSLAFTGAGGYVVNRSGAISGATAGRIFSESIWIKAAGATIGKTANLEIYESGGASGAANTSFPLVVSGEWQEVKGSRTLVANDRTAVEILISLTSSANGDQLYIDGAGVTETAVPQPYIETDGGTAARTAGRVQMPVPTGMSATSGAFLMKLKAGSASSGFPWTNTGTSAPRLVTWYTDGNNRLELLYYSGGFKLESVNAASGANANQTIAFSAGDSLIVLGTYTGTTLKVGVNGAALTSATRTGGAFPGAPTTFDIGNLNGVNNSQIDSLAQWVALYGPGGQFLGNADSQHVNRLGSIIDPLSDLPRPDDLLAFWDGVNDRYLVFA